MSVVVSPGPKKCGCVGAEKPEPALYSPQTSAKNEGLPVFVARTLMRAPDCSLIALMVEPALPMMLPADLFATSILSICCWPPPSMSIPPSACRLPPMSCACVHRLFVSIGHLGCRVQR
jgi:hypothetical protein